MQFVYLVANAFKLFLGGALILFVLELLFPKGPAPSLRGRLTALSFGLVAIPVGQVTWIAVRSLGIAPLLEPHSVLGGTLLAIAAILTYDFLYYWMHRAQHRVPFLWRFHSLHHSIRTLGAGSGYQHWIEPVFQTTLIALPMAFLVRMPGGYIGLIVGLHGAYLHTVTRLNLGPLAKIIADNRTHRIHHSLDPRHFGNNYGEMTMIWDRVFGTAYHPEREWPDVGLEGRPEQETILGYLSYGFTGDVPALAPAEYPATAGSQ